MMEFWSDGVLGKGGAADAPQVCAISDEPLCFVAPLGVAVLVGLPVRAWMRRLVFMANQETVVS
jgi:hypothetical protein